MAFQETRNVSPTFPLTELEYFYLQKFSEGHTPSTLSRTGLNLRAANRFSGAIKRKLAARTLAQGVWKAWDIGIDVIPPYHPQTETNRNLVANLPKTPQDVLRMIAGGYYAVEIDDVLKISHTKRERTITALFSSFSAKTQPELIRKAIQFGFFDDIKPLTYSFRSSEKRRTDRRLSEDQQILLSLEAQAISHAEMATYLSELFQRTTTISMVRKRLKGLRSKISKISGSPTIPPYQTLIKAADGDLFSLSEYMDNQKLSPEDIRKQPTSIQEELEQAYERVIGSGLWIGRNNTHQVRRLKHAYISIGAKNPTQAILMIHALKQDEKQSGGRKEKPMTALQLDIPNGPSFLFTKSDLDALQGTSLTNINDTVASIPNSGYVSAEVQRNGGRAVIIMAQILKDEAPTTNFTDLTYYEVKAAYRYIASVLERYPQIKTAESLLRIIDQRLKKLGEGS